MSKNDNESDAKVNLAPTSVGHSPPDPLLVCFKTVPVPTPMETYLVPLNTKRQGTVELSLYSTLSTISNCLLSNTFRCDNISLARVPQGIGI